MAAVWNSSDCEHFKFKFALHVCKDSRRAGAAVGARARRHGRRMMSILQSRCCRLLLQPVNALANTTGLLHIEKLPAAQGSHLPFAADTPTPLGARGCQRRRKWQGSSSPLVIQQSHSSLQGIGSRGLVTTDHKPSAC